MSVQAVAVAEKMVADALAANQPEYLRILSADFLKYVDGPGCDDRAGDAATITRLAVVLLDASARAGDDLAKSVLAAFPNELTLLREGHFNAPMPQLASC